MMHVVQKMVSAYYMPDNSSIKHKIAASVEERDLGVMVTDNLKLSAVSAQCIKVAAKARSVLGMVKRNFRKLDESDFLILYKTYWVSDLIRSTVCKHGPLTHRKTFRSWRRFSEQPQR